jgi:hypothetical protein
MQQCLALGFAIVIVLYCDVRVTHDSVASLSTGPVACIIMYMGVLARSILLTNSAPAFLEYGKNIPVHIDTMHAAGLHASYSQLESVLLA